jgi:hypothetical protein
MYMTLSSIPSTLGWGEERTEESKRGEKREELERKKREVGEKQTKGEREGGKDGGGGGERERRNMNQAEDVGVLILS